MSMFTITGQVINTFEAPGRKANEKAGIDAQEAKPKVQILGEMPVQGEQKRMELVTLTCEDQTEYESFKGKTVTVPLGIFAPARGQIIYFIPKGSHPVEVLPFPTAQTALKVQNPLHRSSIGDEGPRAA